ncbi:helix-turn-helix domain-containing protein [Rhizomonospora bruguierae]|uniref:helix-turn-helix domain-containing protein n=1 Tax=Rhizomonospora bruguierae TaxID=1581705 RepID=UPI001BCEE289|nr:helix-turn-helix transcriptional regulator [Micromonospora sp. NBRC 107566]
MSAVQGPTVGRRRLRTALRRAREAANLKQEAVAAAMDWSLSKLIRIEAGSVSISTNDVKALLQLYKVADQRLVDELVGLARVARRRTWWSGLKESLPPSYASYIGLEADATRVRYFQPINVPGLLQTEAYARAIMPQDGPHRIAPEEIETKVNIRLTRQREVVGRPDPPEIHAILDEAVLRRVTGSPALMREQLNHLLTISHRRALRIQVLPFHAGYNWVNGPFIVLGFADPTVDGDVVYIESALVEDVIDRPDAIAPYLRIFDKLSAEALSETESRKLIEKVAQELG